VGYLWALGKDHFLNPDKGGLPLYEKHPIMMLAIVIYKNLLPQLSKVREDAWLYKDKLVHQRLGEEGSKLLFKLLSGDPNRRGEAISLLFEHPAFIEMRTRHPTNRENMWKLVQPKPLLNEKALRSDFYKIYRAMATDKESVLLTYVGHKYLLATNARVYPGHVYDAVVKMLEYVPRTLKQASVMMSEEDLERMVEGDREVTKRVCESIQKEIK